MLVLGYVAVVGSVLIALLFVADAEEVNVEPHHQENIRDRQL
jgi:hypothetical protein